MVTRFNMHFFRTGKRMMHVTYVRQLREGIKWDIAVKWVEEN